MTDTDITPAVTRITDQTVADILDLIPAIGIALDYIRAYYPSDQVDSVIRVRDDLFEKAKQGKMPAELGIPRAEVVRIPTHAVHPFRFMSSTCSDACRPLIPTHVVHRFRRMPSGDSDACRPPWSDRVAVLVGL